MRMFELRRISPLRAGVVAAVVSGGFAAALAVLLTPFMLLVMATVPRVGGGQSRPPVEPPAWLPLIFLVVYPLMGALTGFGMGLFGSLAYNFFVSRTGGLEVQVEEVLVATRPPL